MLKDIYVKSPEQRQKYWSGHLLAKYQLVFPQDFYDFWEFASEFARSQLPAASKSVPKPLTTLRAFSDVLDGVVLAGPYEELAGLFEDCNLVDVCYHLHDRYFFDPPEFLTVLKQENKDAPATVPHWGYVRDDPKELPTFIAFNDGQSPTFTPTGDNMFAALKHIVDTTIKEHGPHDFFLMHLFSPLFVLASLFFSTVPFFLSFFPRLAPEEAQCVVG